MGFPNHIQRPIIRGRNNGDSVMVSLKLGTVQTFNPVAASTRAILHGNDVFAPDPLHSSARQPIGFDQWVDQYERFEVLGSSISTRVVNLSSTTLVNWVVYPTYDDINLSYGDSIGQRYAKSAFSDTLGSGKASSRVYSSMGTYKLLGRRTASINFTGSELSSPSKVWDWIFEFTNPQGGNMLFSLQTNVTYHTLFYQRKTLVDA